MIKKMGVMIVTISLIFFAYTHSRPIDEITVEKKGEGAPQVVYEMNNQKKLREFTGLVESFKWYSTGIYTGTDYTFTWGGEQYDVHLHKDKSVEIFRIRDGEIERTVLLAGDAGPFLELMTGGKMER
ncbi:hypothetical protein CN378_17300 [Bacillus sp. AFS015802]|uniref:hypothetical protein n=1 Tax=Bacillus sp. AFS015802 TaxID=2033486 RepID=UPI000BF9B36B|nr:hypothetical protein [Bacillus sp. AFS015802]PFA62800.1 hypothetical protein CN378_17300 [Bacillus sp. AFS015802]